MAKLSSKRQVTIPIEHCNELGIAPGDELEFFVANGQLTVIKKVAGAARGILKSLEVDTSMSDEQSRQSGLG